MNILIQFHQNGEYSETIRIPSTLTKENLQELTNGENFYIKGELIINTIKECIEKLKLNTEEVIIIEVSNDKKTKSLVYCSSSLSGHESPVLSLAYKNGIFVSGGGDCTIRIWDLISKTQKKVVKSHTHWVQYLDVDDFIVSGGMDSKIFIYNLDGSVLRELKGHRKSITGLRIVKINNDFNGDQNDLKENNDNKEDRTNDNQTKNDLKENNDNKENRTRNSNNTLIVSSSKDGTVRVWKITGECIWSIGHNTIIDGINVDDWIISYSRDGIIKIHTLKGQHIETINVHSRINSLKRNQEYIFLGTDEGTAILFKNLKKKLTLKHQKIISSVSISENKIFLATGSFDKTVKLYSIDGNLLSTIRHLDYVYNILFYKNLLITSSKDKSIKIFDIQKKKKVSELICGDQVYCLNVIDGMMMAGCRDKKVYFFE